MSTSERLFTVLMLVAALGWSVLCFGGLFGLGSPAAPLTEVAKEQARPAIELPEVQIVGQRRA